MNTESLLIIIAWHSNYEKSVLLLNIQHEALHIHTFLGLPRLMTEEKLTV